MAGWRGPVRCAASDSMDTHTAQRLEEDVWLAYPRLHDIGQSCACNPVWASQCTVTDVLLLISGLTVLAVPYWSHAGVPAGCLCADKEGRIQFISGPRGRRALLRLVWRFPENAGRGRDGRVE